MRIALLFAGLSLSSCATTTSRLGLPDLQTVPSLTPTRYLGTWYEIASYPQWFQRNCTATTATYTQRDDGDISVVNRCRKGRVDGPLDEAVGRARFVDRVTFTKLEVSFFRPFWGAYWVIDLADDYSYAVVGHPSRDYLWVLSRTPKMSAETYAKIVERIAAQGYPLDRLQRTIQPE